MGFSRRVGSLALGAALVASAASASALELLVNGGFESNAGTVQSPDPITGWAALESGLIGGIASLPGSTGPGSGHTTVGAASGANYALFDLSQPAYTVLYQSFTLGAAGIASGQVSYQLFATSFAGIAPPDLALDKGLDFGNADAMLTVRVDILKPGADPLTVDSGDLVASYLPSVNYAGSDAVPTGYGSYAHALDAAKLLAGQTYTLRFAAAGNAGQALVGIDDVSVQVTAVPEPATWGLLAAGLALVGAATRRRT